MPFIRYLRIQISILGRWLLHAQFDLHYSQFTRDLDRILCLNYIFLFKFRKEREREKFAPLISITVYVSYYTKLRFNSLPQRIHLSFKLKSDNVSFKVVTNRAQRFSRTSWNSNWNLQAGVAVQPCSMN